MRLRIECAVDSDTFIDGEFNVEVDERTFTFTPDEQGRLVNIAITAPVPDMEKFRSEIKDNPRPGVKADVIHNIDKDLFESLIGEFQALESHIAFSFRLSKIDWQNARVETICESDEEREIAKILMFQMSRTPREKGVRVSADAMAKLIVGTRRYAPLNVPMAFFREGLNDFNSLRFINAFFNFYFIAEGLFGGGKTKNYLIEAEFKAQAGLRWAIESSMEAMRKEDPRLYGAFVQNLARTGRPETVDGIIEHLVRTRGRLHHFTHNPARLEGTPFTNPAFESLAEFAKAIAIFAIMHFIVEINNGRGPAA